MQYGLNVNKYEEVKNLQKTNRRIDVRLPMVKLTLIFIVGVLLGRVSFLLNQSDSKGIAPFGIAYLMAVAIRNDKQKNISATLKGIGLKPEESDSAIRFSFCFDTTKEEIDYAINVIKDIISILRKFVRK